MFMLIDRLLRPAVHPQAPMPAPRPLTEPPAAAERPLGCGWFDSSHELLSGVSVWEGIIVIDNTVASPT